MHFSTVLSCKIHFTLRNCEQFIATTLSTGNFYIGGAMGFDRHQDLLGHRLPLHKPLLNHSFLVNVSCMTFMKNLQNKLYKLNVFKKYCNLCVYGCTLTFFSHSTITNLVNTFQEQKKKHFQQSIIYKLMQQIRIISSTMHKIMHIRVLNFMFTSEYRIQCDFCYFNCSMGVDFWQDSNI